MSIKIYFYISYTLLIVFMNTHCFAKPGILNEKAPNWDGVEWVHNTSNGKVPKIGDMRGQVLYLYCFQSWCPGCHSHGFPVMKKLIEHYEGNEHVKFIAIQTVFEGFSYNMVQKGIETAKKYNLYIPIGHSGSEQEYSQIMQKYKTGGTPWTILIDPQGIVRYNEFHIDEQTAIKLIDQMLKG